jgi:hypothetical protein
MGNGMGGGGGGAEPLSCREACEAAHPSSVDAEKTYDQCIRTACMPTCAGS